MPPYHFKAVTLRLPDGIYRVSNHYLCASFVVEGGMVSDCAPILRKNLASWSRSAQLVLAPSETLHQNQAVNHITVVGQLKDDARIMDGKLVCTVIVKRKGSGQYADRVFTSYFKVRSFGRENDSILPKLKAGTWVTAAGEAEAEPYESKKDNKWRAVVVIKGLAAVQPLDFGGASESEGVAMPSPRAAAQAPAPEAQTSDDVPF